MAISVLDILEETAQRLPDKTACIDVMESLNYAQLVHVAKITGFSLVQELNEKQKPIVLFMEKSCRCLTAMLSTLYSGNIYVPVDIKTPLERFHSILHTLQTSYVLTSAKDKKTLEKIGYQGKVLIYEELLEKYGRSDYSTALEEIRASIMDIDLMYILFTSGSTGVPKGVAIRYCSVIDYINSYVSEIGIREDDTVGNQAPFYNDMSIRDIFMPIKAGATICIIPPTYFMSPKKLLEYLDEQHVTYTCWAPTAYSIIAQFDALSKVCPKNLRKILFSGEVMPIPLLNYWKKYYPDAEFYQLYGPTEITGVCLYQKITRDYDVNERIPLGKAFKNTGIILLDENNQVIEKHSPNVQGELCVYGICIAAGYYNNPEKTAEVFVQNPTVTGYQSLIYRTGDLARWDTDGNLIFVSRKDFQIKHSGRRIELGEIEAAVLSLRAVKTCCCVHNREKDELVLYYVGDITAKEIMLGVQPLLPKYMIPTVFRKEDTLPVLGNGKLNRKLMSEWGNT